jgi:hypothetical protein
MRKAILITTALLASTALAAAQGTPQGKEKEGASPAPSVQRSAPAEKMDQRGTQMKPAETSGQAQKAGEAKEPAKAASESKPADSKAMPNRADTQKPMDNKADANKAAADDKSKADATKAASDNKAGEASRSATTGQGAAGSRAAVNLSTEQKTTVRTVIREKVKAQPLTNVNFSISVGTRVPRDVRYYPLPAEIVQIHPAWSGYHFILVNDQIVILDPSTFEIVAIIV